MQSAASSLVGGNSPLLFIFRFLVISQYESYFMPLRVWFIYFRQVRTSLVTSFLKRSFVSNSVTETLVTFFFIEITFVNYVFCYLFWFLIIIWKEEATIDLKHPFTGLNCDFAFLCNLFRHSS